MTKITARAVENLDVLHRLATPAEGDTSAGVGRELGREKSNFAKTLGLLRSDGFVGDGLDLTPAGQRVARLFRPDGEIRVAGDQLLLRHRELESDPENERTEIADADVEDMAASLAELGQLQPISVRAPAKPEGKHRVFIGELRWRGVGRAIEAGDWPADRPMRCTLISEADATRLVIMRMSENLRRKDLHELDEGRGFKRLRDEHKLSTDEIARRLGRSRRHVQDRIFVFENTDAATQARMRLPEKDPRHVRYTDARDDATSHKPAQPSPPAQPGPASPPPPPQPAEEGFDVAFGTGTVPTTVLRALAELAHKIHHEPAVKGAAVAATFGHHADATARLIESAGFARFLTVDGRQVAAITQLGRETLAKERRPRVSGPPFTTPWLNPPPAKVPASSLDYEGAADVLRAVARWPSSGLTSLESAVSMTLNSPWSIARRLDGLAREGLIDRPRAATITPGGLHALEALDAPSRRTEPFDPPRACSVCRGRDERRVIILGRDIACPICNGGSWLAALPEPPPALAESHKPRSEAHALVGDDFSRQIREAAAVPEADPASAELADEVEAFPRHLSLSFGRVACTIEGEHAKLDLDGWPFKLVVDDAKALRVLLADAIIELQVRAEGAE